MLVIYLIILQLRTHFCLHEYHIIFSFHSNLFQYVFDHTEAVLQCLSSFFSLCSGVLSRALSVSGLHLMIDEAGEASIEAMLMSEGHVLTQSCLVKVSD